MITAIFLSQLAMIVAATANNVHIKYIATMIFMVSEITAIFLYEKLKSRVKKLEDKEKGGAE